MQSQYPKWLVAILPCGLVKGSANRRHVLTENAMCLTVAEQQRWLKPPKTGKMLAQHHNRQTGIRRIREIVYVVP
jgi:hypothetical protein